MEQLHSADPPMVIDRLDGDYRRQLGRHWTGGASHLGRLLANAPTFSTPAHRAIYVRAALCGQVA